MPFVPLPISFLDRYFPLWRASLEGFRLMRAHPGSVAIWVGAYLVSLIGLGVLITTTIGRAGIIGLSVRFSAAAAQPARIPEFILHFGWIPAGLLLLSLMVGVVLVAAMYRAVLAPGEFKIGYMRVGRDELRLLVVSLLTPLLVPGVPVAIGLPLASNAFNTEGAAGWLGFLCLLGLAGLSIWLMVRLTLVGPMTLDRGEHSIEDSWRMTRGRFLPLLGVLVLTIIWGVGVSVIGTAVSTAVFEILNHIRPHHRGISPILIAIRFGELVVPAMLGTLSWIILAAPAAALYRDLREQAHTLGTVDKTGA